ncbi:MAG: GGDEF domain-containing protein [Lachnospiraceae bacterium]|nr:GGDEF domain-containing protein [Lachnospiraceae bacterium]
MAFIFFNIRQNLYELAVSGISGAEMYDYFLSRSIVYIMGLLAGVVLIGGMTVCFVERFIIKPINKISYTADSYKMPRGELGELERNDFAKLNIKSKDEIESLVESLKNLEKELNDRNETLYATRQELLSTREQAAVMNEMANRDALTGIRNKRGYDAEVARVNERIVAGLTHVGIVMVDMNELKNVNDTYGHEKGDRVICNLCDILCSIFKRSPVFRIGGDEFVVVAENQDFKNIEKNVEQFKACIVRSIKEEELEPWERTNASIGYAIYDKDKDCGIEDTLKRADENMYEDKRKMRSSFDNERNVIG